jgi:alpha-amylase
MWSCTRLHLSYFKVIEMKKLFLGTFLFIAFFSCEKRENARTEIRASSSAPFSWAGANIYFLLTDRFSNGNPDNDVNFGRTAQTAVLRGFEGGDLQGITDKINEGYFSDLGINAIWFTPIVEQVHGLVDEGTGKTYGYHGYWAKDWTAIDPNFGTEADLKQLVETAHAMGIRIILDVVVNHTGPVTEKDPVWPQEWVRTQPVCTYTNYETTVECTLVKNLPDIRTESNADVELPKFLLEKWESEGRLQQELDELNAFFTRTGYPRAPKYYIIKWITDYIRKYGVDGFRVDTAKHTEADVWSDLYKEANTAFAEWKAANPDRVLDHNEFYMVGEVYNYVISSGRMFDFGDQQVDYFQHGFNSLINFEFKHDALNDYEAIFSKYDNLLHGTLAGKSVVNYLTSHDDGSPFDQKRSNPLEAGTKLLLCPGATQVYYGDETSRSLIVDGTSGDATLRSFMNWDELELDTVRSGHIISDVLWHWQKLGRFRANHPAVGAGRHTMISESPYLFKRTLETDQVLVGLNMPIGSKTINVLDMYRDNIELIDYYSGAEATVKDGEITIDTPFDIVLLGK